MWYYAFTDFRKIPLKEVLFDFHGLQEFIDSEFSLGVSLIFSLKYSCPVCFF